MCPDDLETERGPRQTWTRPRSSPSVLRAALRESPPSKGMLLAFLAVTRDLPRRRLAVRRVPQPSTSDTLRRLCMPHPAGRVPQALTSAAQVSSCVPQGEPSVPFGAIREGSSLFVRASGSNECAASHDFCASVADLRSAPRADCAFRLHLRAACHSQRPRKALPSTRSQGLACLWFERRRH